MESWGEQSSLTQMNPVSCFDVDAIKASYFVWLSIRYCIVCALSMGDGLRVAYNARRERVGFWPAVCHMSGSAFSRARYVWARVASFGENAEPMVAANHRGQ